VIQVRVTCPECKAQRWLSVDAMGFKAWKAGMPIQRALPELSPDDREALITGFCNVCWDVMFGFEDFESEFANV